MAAEVVGGGAEDPRVAWANALRLKVSPPKAVDAAGALVQEFFKPTKVVLVQQKKWGEAERAALLTGLEKHGVGKWQDMRAELLPGWDALALRVKTAKLLGSQSVARYTGRTFTADQIAAEYDANKALGERLGCWKQGVLVDVDGRVEAELAKQAEEPPAKKQKA